MEMNCVQFLNLYASYPIELVIHAQYMTKIPGVGFAADYIIAYRSDKNLVSGLTA